MALPDPLINALFDNRYRIVRKLGAGGMANVYLAEDQELGRRVAIKILNDRHAGDQQFIDRFRREAQNAAGLSHRNIVSTYDRGEAEGTYYIAMEYVEGKTLKELIVARGPSPVRIAIEYTRQILSALRFAHRNGIVHRDIKPHNVIVDDEGHVRVMDFGIARAGASQMTETGSIIGTAQYLSPEQARGAPVDQTSDIYSTGIVLYELLTGTTPFTGDTPVEIAMKHLSQTPDPPSAKRPDVPRDLDYVVLRALAKDPAERYRNAEEMDADLDRIARGSVVSAETAEAATSVLSRPSGLDAPTTVQPPARTPSGRPYEPAPRRRSRWPRLLLLLGLIAALGAGGYYTFDRVSNELRSAKPVAVPDVEGLQQSLAVAQLVEDGLVPAITRVSHDTVEEGVVIEQDPKAGERIDRGNAVTLIVSEGKKKTPVPEVRGQGRDDAVQAIADAGLKARVVEVNSDKLEGTVTAQEPSAGETVEEGTVVRINVSKGPKAVEVPNVVGLRYDSAVTVLEAVGFVASKNEVSSNDAAADVVVGQDPGGKVPAPKGSTVTLQVSTGPSSSAVPAVANLDEASATETLEGAGFRVKVAAEDTTDPALDGVVVSQDPPAGTVVKPGSKVTIFVGRFVSDTTGPPIETIP